MLSCFTFTALIHWIIWFAMLWYFLSYFSCVVNAASSFCTWSCGVTLIQDVVSIFQCSVSDLYWRWYFQKLHFSTTQSVKGTLTAFCRSYQVQNEVSWKPQTQEIVVWRNNLFQGCILIYSQSFPWGKIALTCFPDKSP